MSLFLGGICGKQEEKHGMRFNIPASWIFNLIIKISSIIIPYDKSNLFWK